MRGKAGLFIGARLLATWGVLQPYLSPALVQALAPGGGEVICFVPGKVWRCFSLDKRLLDQALAGPLVFTWLSLAPCRSPLLPHFVYLFRFALSLHFSGGGLSLSFRSVLSLRLVFPGSPTGFQCSQFCFPLLVLPSFPQAKEKALPGLTPCSMVCFPIS